MIHDVTGNPFDNCIVYDRHDIMVPCTSNFVIFDEEIDLAFRNNFRDGYSAFNRLKNEDIVFSDTSIFVTDNDTGIRFFPLVVPQGTETYLSDNMRPTNFMVNQLDDYFGRIMRSRVVDIPYFHTYYSWEGIIIPQLQKYNNNMNAEIFLFDRVVSNGREMSRERYESERIENILINDVSEEEFQEEMSRLSGFPIDEIDLSERYNNTEVDTSRWGEKITREDLNRIESFHLMKKQREEEEEIRLDF